MSTNEVVVVVVVVVLVEYVRFQGHTFQNRNMLNVIFFTFKNL